MTTSISASFKSLLCPTVPEMEAVPKTLMPETKSFSWKRPVAVDKQRSISSGFVDCRLKKESQIGERFLPSRY